MAMTIIVGEEVIMPLFCRFQEQMTDLSFTMNEFCFWIKEQTGILPSIEYGYPPASEEEQWVFTFEFETEEDAVKYRLEWL